MRKASEAEGRRLQKLPWNKFEDVTSEAKRKHFILGGTTWPVDKVYQNNKYIVQVFYNDISKGRQMTRVMVRRSDGAAICNWQDLFRLKNEIFGEEIEAIQYLPKKSELTDVANLYWFFIEEKSVETELITGSDPGTPDGDYPVTTTGYKCGKCGTLNILDVKIDKVDING
jgi:hypothetical protein